MPREPEKTERNVSIYKDFLEGKMSQYELVSKYKVSATRVYQIVRDYQKKYPFGLDEFQVTIPNYDDLDPQEEHE